MSYVSLSYPSSKSATKKSLIDQIIDNDADLNARISIIETGDVQNGSFEFATDTLPDGWTVANSNTTFLLDDADQTHGAISAQFTFSSTIGQGTLFSSLMPVREGDRIRTSFDIIGSVASLPASIKMYFYNADESFLSSPYVWSSSDIATSWKRIVADYIAPANARYRRTCLYAGDLSSAIANETVAFDNVRSTIFHGFIPCTHPYTEVAPTNDGFTAIPAALYNTERPIAAWIYATADGDGEDGLLIQGQGANEVVVFNSSIAASSTVGPFIVSVDELAQFYTEVTGTTHSVIKFMGYEV